MITNLKDFIAAVDRLPDVSQAFDLFEYKTHDDVRALIYSLAPAGAVEPFRAAMHVMGYTDF